MKKLLYFDIFMLHISKAHWTHGRTTFIARHLNNTLGENPMATL